MADVIRFQLRLREPPSGRRQRRRKADFLVFPYNRRRDDVERHAEAMRGLSQVDAEIYLERVLTDVCDEFKRFGFECEGCEAERAINDLGEAIGKALWGPNFVLRIEGDAQ